MSVRKERFDCDLGAIWVRYDFGRMRCDWVLWLGKLLSWSVVGSEKVARVFPLNVVSLFFSFLFDFVFDFVFGPVSVRGLAKVTRLIGNPSERQEFVVRSRMPSAMDHVYLFT